MGAHDRILRLGWERKGIIGGGTGVEPVFAELIEAAAGVDAA
jgi:NAD(P)H-flavin reductase